MIEVFEFIKQSLAQGEHVAMVVLTESDAHTPGRTGAIMAVRANGTTAGTVGGGAMEYQLTQDALRCIASKQGSSFEKNLNKEYGMLCGGQVKGYINVLSAGERLIIFGGGHVSQVVAQVAETAGFLVAVVEDRPEFKEQFAPTIQYHHINPLEAVEALEITKADLCLIVTRGHAQDKEILRMLAPLPLRYLGMIGSAPKVTATIRALHTEGLAKEDLERVYAPVGLDIDQNTLGEIGISIVAEIVAVKNGKAGAIRHRCMNPLEIK